MNDDPWIKANSIIEPERLHALGVILLRWNSCETGLFVLTMAILGSSVDVIKALVHEMSESALSDRLRDVLAVQPVPNQAAHDATIYSLDLFGVNRVNRNTLAHFLPTTGKSGMEFWRTKGPKFEAKPIPNDLESLRRVAGEMLALIEYMGAVANHLIALRYGRMQPKPLPDKPPMPQPLWTPPQAGKGPQSPPQSGGR